MNLGYFLEENYDELSEEIQEIKESCRDAKLKVILRQVLSRLPKAFRRRLSSQSIPVRTSSRHRQGKVIREPLRKPFTRCAKS